MLPPVALTSIPLLDGRDIKESLAPPGLLATQVIPPGLSLAGAAEEMTFARSESREQEAGVDDVHLELAAESADWKELSDTLELMFGRDTDERKRLAVLIEGILRGRDRRSPSEGMAEQAFSDVSKQYLFLRSLASGAELAGQQAVAEDAHDAAARLESKKRRAVRAGINTVKVANEFGDTSAAADYFRGVYRDAVLAGESLRDMLKKLLERFGEAHFERGIPLLLRALGDDLASICPSCDPVRLHAILGDLYLLETTVTIHEKFRGLSKRFSHRYKTGINPVALMEVLVDIVESPQITREQCSALSGELAGDAAAQVDFMQNFLDGAKELPIKIWMMIEDRQYSLDVIQNIVDVCVKRELRLGKN